MRACLLLVLTCLAASATGQHRKAPVTAIANGSPVPEPAPGVREAGILQYTQLEFTSNRAGGLDTSKLQRFALDSQGRVTEWIESTYNSTDAQDSKSAKPAGLHNVKRYVYAYDSTGHILSVRHYIHLRLSARNALRARLMLSRTLHRPGAPLAATQGNADYTATLERYIDSLRAGADPWLLTQDARMEYDADGNVIRIDEPLLPGSSSVSYTYGPDGTVLTELSRSRLPDENSDSGGSYRRLVTFSYDPAGRVAEVRLYGTGSETAPLQADSNLISTERMRYTARGERASVSLTQKYRFVEELSAYENGHRTASTALSAHDPGAKTDTVSHSTYRYADGRLSASTSSTYGPPSYAIRTETHYTYNDRGLPRETLVINRMKETGRRSGVRLTLYFYGNAAEDRKTAERPEQVLSALPER